MAKLVIMLRCTVCELIFDASDRGYNLNYMMGRPAVCDKCKEHNG